MWKSWESRAHCIEPAAQNKAEYATEEHGISHIAEQSQISKLCYGGSSVYCQVSTAECKMPSAKQQVVLVQLQYTPRELSAINYCWVADCLQFGEIDIDSELVAKKEILEGSNDTIMQLSNGCLCCTVREDLINALNRLVRPPEHLNLRS
jgi:hypothetical protein